MSAPPESARFLGFAFASADLLFEIGRDGRIAFAMGAAHQAFDLDEDSLAGRSWRELLPESDHELVAAFLTGVGVGDRRGPIRIDLKPRPGSRSTRHANLSACRLPQLGGAISCSLTLGAIGFEHGDAHAGLRDLDGFLDAARTILSDPPAAPIDVELVQLTGLEQTRSGLNAADAQAILDAVAATLRAESIGGDAAAQLADERFALIRDASRPRQALIDGLNRVSEDHGGGFDVDALSLGLGQAKDPALAVNALRFALQAFVDGDAEGAKRTFDQILGETIAEAEAFADMVRQRRFKLAYQPVVDLATGELSHFEVLARFGEGSPQRAILMAEALDLIEDFDLAVAEIAQRQLRVGAHRQLRLAINLSARSLMRPGFLDRLWDKVSPRKDITGRLAFELTESAEIRDLAAANGLIQKIRDKGFQVCLDDFGAGASSLAYLQALTVDTVKIDGRYVRELTEQGRDGAVVRHLVGLCGELGVSTIAEMVETAEVAEVLRGLGVGYGQGWLYGKPQAQPVFTPPAGLRGVA